MRCERVKLPFFEKLIFAYLLDMKSDKWHYCHENSFNELIYDVSIRYVCMCSM